MRVAHVVHHVPGRIRFKVPSARNDPSALERIERALGQEPEVHRVQVNSMTGSVVVDYDPSTSFPRMMEQTSRATERDNLLKFETPESGDLDIALGFAQDEMQALAEHSHAAKNVVQLVQEVNSGVKRVTGNALDLRVLLPLCLSAYSIMSDKDKPSPLWVTLLIFSFNAFVSLHPPRPAPMA
ncbi:MAG: heavy-metal-associated domain-containing protein [Pseudomonadota bacterium]|nr:heavy-metal-associated domain-containing protein [Pseudomonadota bacterium]MDQ2763548.1 heavy-metal-associated domain-containing protein [Pseudomonadota bacterium]